MRQQIIIHTDVGGGGNYKNAYYNYQL